MAASMPEMGSASLRRVLYNFSSSRRRAKWRPTTTRIVTTTTDPGGVDAVTRDRVAGRLPAVVRNEADRGRPDDPARRIPEEEPPPREASEAGDPRRGEAEDRDKAAEEHRPPPVLVHEPFGLRDHAVTESLQPLVTAEERPAAEAPDQPVAEVVADDRGSRRDGDHLRDRVVALRGEHAEEDERRLARKRNAERLEHHDEEEKRQAVMREEVGHGCIESRG